MTKCPLISPK
jgi:hypothetical protein